VSFHAFDRDFTLDLAPSQQVFAPGVKFLLNHEETTGYDPQTFYQGQVVGTCRKLKFIEEFPHLSLAL